jgi:sec-independent protein translocase protein TatA
MQPEAIPGLAECDFSRRTRRNSMGELLTPTHLIVVLVVALLIFGPRKLPELGKGLGEGLRGFKDAIKGTPEPVKQDTPAPKPEITSEVK